MEIAAFCTRVDVPRTLLDPLKEVGRHHDVGGSAVDADSEKEAVHDRGAGLPGRLGDQVEGRLREQPNPSSKASAESDPTVTGRTKKGWQPCSNVPSSKQVMAWTEATWAMTSTATFASDKRFARREIILATVLPADRGDGSTNILP